MAGWNKQRDLKSLPTKLSQGDYHLRLVQADNFQGECPLQHREAAVFRIRHHSRTKDRAAGKVETWIQSIDVDLELGILDFS